MKKVLCYLLCILLVCTDVPVMAETVTPYSYGAWLPYWEIKASLEEAEGMQRHLDMFIAFACLFDSKDHLLMPEETKDLLTALQQAYTCEGKTVFLSVVNDVEISGGKYENKSSALLKRLFLNEESRSRHLEQLASLIDTYQLEGIELDYENIKGNTELWSSYALFIEKVWAMCKRDGIRLRIVLPWDAPRFVSLPEGPEYSVMCYNLYGYHSGAGPKADIAFLRTICELYQNVPGLVSMAFATGGFDWNGGKITALTQEEAQKQLQDVVTVPTRDINSGALTATYRDGGVKHELWYADALTLSTWRDVCAEYGFTSFDLFRLGGDDKADWATNLFKAEP